jgi:protoporphyrinogen/coproporphyrinogen III oxidase
VSPRTVPGVGRPRVVVVGAGLTGLATAWHLRADAEVTVLEAGGRLGGQIRTVAFDDTRLDVGADAFLARQPEAERLVRALGLGDELVAPSTGRVHLWRAGRLRPLPAATVLGAPTDLRALARARVLSPAGLARAALEPVWPRRFVPGDRSVADLVGERFGREVVDQLVEPLLAGVYAGQVDRLSAEATVAPLWAAARGGRSLRSGLRAHRDRAASDQRPVFLTVRGGLGRVVDALAADLDVVSGAVVTGVTPIPAGTAAVGVDERDAGTAGTAAVRPGEGAAADAETEAAAATSPTPRWRVTTADGRTIDAHHVVVAVPATAAAEVLAEASPAVARELIAIRTASVAVIALAYDRGDTREVPAGSGILVPRAEGRLIKAVTFASQKWPHHAEHPRFLLRASVGRIDDQRGLDLGDDDLAERVDAEVRWATGIRAPAVARSVMRWDEALPQYDVGHVRRVDRIRMALDGLAPGLHVGGASLDGVGLSARARDGQRLAAAVRAPAAR